MSKVEAVYARLIQLPRIVERVGGPCCGYQGPRLFHLSPAAAMSKRIFFMLDLALNSDEHGEMLNRIH